MHKDEEVMSAKEVVVKSFISLADPDSNNKTDVICKKGAQRMGMLSQTTTAQKQVVHRDGHYYSAMISRHSSTTVLMYVRDGAQLIEFQMRIPPGYIMFWEGNVHHAGDAYPEEVPKGSERIFCYVDGYDKDYYNVTLQELNMTKEEMCAQQHLEPKDRALHETAKDLISSKLTAALIQMDRHAT